MRKNILISSVICTVLYSGAALAVGAGTVVNDSASRSTMNSSASINNTNYNNSANMRGKQGAANAYVQNQRNTYFIVTQPDVDTACRQKIYACLTDYCGDATVIPGKTSGKCLYATESELYNYTLLCLQKDTSILLPQYNTNTKTGVGGMNTAARLCPSYVQQELMSYLSMANMADKLTKSQSNLCTERRRELEAAMACHSVALAYGNETTSMLKTQLTDYCGPGVSGGSTEMVTRFVNAGNVGANIWGWAEKIVNLEMNSKGENWEAAVDAVLASYTNRMNLACGDNIQLNTVTHPTTNNTATTLQTAAAVLAGAAFLTTTGAAKVENPYENWSVYMEVQSMSELYSYDTARQVVMAGLTNNALTQNSFLSSSQMDSMQTAYKLGTKVFIIRDSARCYTIPVTTLSQAETSLVAQSFANCISR